MAVSGLAEGLLHAPICGFEACKGTMACRLGMLRRKPMQMNPKLERRVAAPRGRPQGIVVCSRRLSKAREGRMPDDDETCDMSNPQGGRIGA
jgi:hypothetical protein